MSKRESDTNLEEFLVQYFKKRKYHKTSELFERILNQERLPTKSPRCEEKFVKYLKRNTAKLKNEKFIDLDFEINFSAYQYDSKVRLKIRVAHDAFSCGENYD